MLARSGRLRAAFTQRDAVRLAVVTIIFALSLGAVLAVDALPGPLLGSGAVVDNVATVDIRAPYTGRYESAEETQRRQDQARAQVAPQYDYTPERGRQTAEAQLAELQSTIASVDAAFAAVLTPEARAVALRNAVPRLSMASRTTLASLERNEWLVLRAEMERALDARQRVEVRDTLLADARLALGMSIDDSLPSDQRALAAEIVAPLLVANSTYDPAATETARDSAAAQVEPVVYEFRVGEILVQRGQRLDPLLRERLDVFGLLDPRPDPSRAAGWGLLALLLASLLLLWLWRFRPTIWHRNSALLLVSLAVLAAAIALKVTGDRSLLPYFVPTAAIALLLAVLLDSGAALIVLAIMSLVAGAIVGTVEFAAYTFLGGLAGIILVRRGERLSNFLQAALAIAVVNVIVVSMFTLLGERDLTGLLQLLLAGMTAAGMSALLAVGSFAVLGNLFGITTSFQLLELANPSQPLLRRLLLETPGTYHHSLMVGNLAERAAEAIGADPLLARVAAYYHDIGKLANPMAFIENQATGENVHDTLTPEQSVTLLKSHVGDGIDLAYQYRLPKAVIAFIPQHHGTALMSYFHARARDRAIEEAGARPGTPQAVAAAAAVEASRFRHAGPKPQSREAAILMLADGVEASVRSLTSQEEPAIRAMVERIIRERLEDGQFDECDLTLRDLEQIREAFIAQLLGMYHRRIEYPQNKIVELETRRAANTGTGA
ncbi:MAG TPA: HDIG domain-containing protein [Candidatus Limnocylindrales bacterium]|nr:HDIG domain-containing protein [Candidatus Limnocylindrales bacterium]